MKKILSLLFASALSLGVMNASVLLNEHFDRPLGDLPASTWSGGSVPNDSAWHVYSPGSVLLQVVNSQLQFADYCSAATGKAVQYSANHSRNYLLLKNALSGSAGSKVYLAFLMKVNAGGLQTGTGATSTSNANNSVAAFHIDASSNALGVLNGRVIIRTVDEATYCLGVSRRGETVQFAEEQLKTGNTYLVVAEYAFVEGEKNDIVSLYINPTPALQTAAVASVNTSTASADATQIVGVVLNSNGNTPTDMLIDELRVATSWDDLWEDSSVPVPTITAAASVDCGKVAVGEETQRTLVVQGTNLQGGISVSSDNPALVPGVQVIPQAEAEQQSGYALTLKLTATKQGAGKANLILSSAGASDQVVVVNWTAAMPVPPAGTELLDNAGFEDYSCNAMFGCSFDVWSLPLSSASPETTDKIEGEAAMLLNPVSGTANLDQGVALIDEDYAAGTLFKLTINYKTVSLPENTRLALDCYWVPVGGGDAEAMKQHDADVLQQTLAETADNEWQKLSVTTSKPAGSTTLRVRVIVPKNAQVLLDDFSLVQTANTEPFIHVTPAKLNAVETTLGNSVQFPALRIEQGNLSGATSFELSYTDAAMFSLSQSSLAADQSACELVITYAPTAAGVHTAYLNIDNPAHTSLHQTIKLQGSCSDPAAQPALSITPATLPAFEAKVGQTLTKTFTVTSVNCTDFVYLSVEHVQGSAFTIDASMLSKNTSSEVTVRFAPMEAGTYQSVVTATSLNAESVTLTLNGTATGGGDTIEWATEFVWDDSQPLAVMDEHFDNAEHNQPLQISGWQNVAAADARPWWGMDATQTSLFDGDNKCAKATAYEFGKPSTGLWEMWLVTPALDYRNAPTKVFAFSVMGQYLPEEEIQAVLEIYYIDATNPENVFRQDLTGSFSIPKTSDEDSQWVSFVLDLEPYAETMADVFRMAFRYEGPNGADGAVTYYIDDVSWGVVKTAVDELSSQPAVRKTLRDGQVLIMRGDAWYSVLGTRVE